MIVAWLAPASAAAYPRRVLTAIAARVDRRIADLILARARRRWPLLRLMPRTCARPLIVPAATLARRDLLRAALLAMLLAGAALFLIGAF
jgi:hypothetical protein